MLCDFELALALKKPLIFFKVCKVNIVFLNSVDFNEFSSICCKNIVIFDSN